MHRERWFRWGDLIPAAICVVLALVFLLRPLLSSAGDCAVIRTPTEDFRLPLYEDTLLTVIGNGGLTVTVAVGNGTVRVSAADCPDQVCVHTGALSKNGQTAACLPSGITVTVESDDGPDAVAR